MTFKRHNKGKTKSRSGFEERIKRDLDSRGVKYGYESIRMRYTKTCCPHCGGVVQESFYTPDFILNTGIPSVVESKGFFDSADRTKMLLVKRDNPDACIRILLQRDNPIRRGSKTLYSGWCIKHGFEYAVGEHIPDAWLSSHKPGLPGVGRKEQGDENEVLRLPRSSGRLGKRRGTGAKKVGAT